MSRKLLCFTLLLALTSIPAFANRICLSDPHDQMEFSSFKRNLNLDLRDYGKIFLDILYTTSADSNPNCLRDAAGRLFSKVKATNDVALHDDTGLQWTEADGTATIRSVGPYQGWLEGGGIYLAFAAATRLSERGELSRDFDTELMRARDSYYASLSTPSPYGLDKDPRDSDKRCGIRFSDSARNGYWMAGGNTCMDDHAVAASAFAWIAAYEQKRGRDATKYIDAARAAVDKAFDLYESVCINKNGTENSMTVETGGPCNGSVADLANGAARIRSLNHGYENIPYGLGLMTSLSVATVGLEEAGAITAGNRSSYFSPTEKTIAQGLLTEGQQKTVSSGDSFKENCRRYGVDPANPSRVIVTSTTEPCRDDNAYLPRMYPLERFYQLYGLGTPAASITDPDDTAGSLPAYSFGDDAADEQALFQDDIFSEGRRATYIDLSYYWQYLTPPAGKSFAPRPALSGNTRSWGYLDGISSTGVASGWACDQREPGRAVELHIYSVSATGAETYQLSALADQGNEPAVTGECRGGTAHRFAVTLPAAVLGQNIHVYAIEPTWRGYSTLPAYTRGGTYYRGLPSLLWRNNSSGANAFWLMNGTSYSSTTDLQGLPDTNYRAEALADFNGDGILDILWRNYATGASAIWVLNGTAPPQVVDLNWLSSSFHFQGAADMNGDGWPDIFIRDFSNGANYVWIMNGTSLVSTLQLPGLPNLDYTIAGVADFDHDGHPDVLWRNGVTGANAIWLMNGTTLLSIVNLPGLPNPDYHIGAVLDLNSDGSPDIVWRNSVTGANAIWIMNGTTFSQTIVNLPPLTGPWELGGPR